MKNRLYLTMLMGMSLGLAACDTDYGSIDKTPYPNNEPIAGVWTGTYVYTPPGTGSTAETVDTLLVGSETNEFWMIESNETSGCVHISYGGAESRQANVNGTFGWSSSCTFTDGSNYGSGTLSGTADLHVTISLSITETDSKNYLYATFSPAFTFQDVYLEGSSLATVAGNFTAASGVSITIDSSGMIMGGTVGSCTAAGAVSLMNSQFNLYRIVYTLSGCTANGDMALNGVQLTGMGYLDDTSTSAPHTFNLVLHGTDTNGLGVVFADRFTAI